MVLAFLFIFTGKIVGLLTPAASRVPPSRFQHISPKPQRHQLQYSNRHIAGKSSKSLGVFQRSRARLSSGKHFPSLAPSTSVLNTANTLTIARMFSIPFFMVALSTGKRRTSISIYIASCITDFLDGYIARKYQQCSSFGSFLDPVADKLLVATALILLMSHVNTVPFAVAVALILCREIFVSALREWMAEKNARADVQVGPLGKIKTALQMISTALLIAFLPHSNTLPSMFVNSPPPVLYKTGIATFYASALLTIWSGVQYFVAALPSLLN